MADLTFIQPSFRVAVADQTDFGTEIEQLRRRRAIRPLTNLSEASADQIDAFRDKRITLVDTLENKLRIGFPEDSPSELGNKADQYISWNIDRANLLYSCA